MAVATVASVHFLNLHYSFSQKHAPSVPKELQPISVRYPEQVVFSIQPIPSDIHNVENY